MAPESSGVVVVDELTLKRLVSFIAQREQQPPIIPLQPGYSQVSPRDSKHAVAKKWSKKNQLTLTFRFVVGPLIDALKKITAEQVQSSMSADEGDKMQSAMTNVEHDAND